MVFVDCFQNTLICPLFAPYFDPYKFRTFFLKCCDVSLSYPFDLISFLLERSFVVHSLQVGSVTSKLRLYLFITPILIQNRYFFVKFSKNWAPEYPKIGFWPKKNFFLEKFHYKVLENIYLYKVLEQV